MTCCVPLRRIAAARRITRRAPTPKKEVPNEAFLARPVLLAVVPFAASAADGISYNYVEGGYMKTDTDAATPTVGPPTARGAFSSQLPCVRRLRRTRNVDNICGADFDQWRLGVGYNRTLSPTGGPGLAGGLREGRLRRDTASKHDGYTAEVGVRGASTPMLRRLCRCAGYGDLEHSNGEFYAKLGTQAKFNQNWGVAGDVKFISGDTQWFVGPRLSW